MDLILDRRYQTVRIVRSSDYHGHLIERDLRLRHEIARPQFGTQVAISNVSHYADDLAPVRFVFTGGDSRLDAFAYRILVREKLFRERLIDNDDSRRLLAVALSKLPSLQHRHAQRLEISRH